MEKKTAIIIGAGPAGLTAAYELLEKTDIKLMMGRGKVERSGITGKYGYATDRKVQIIIDHTLPPPPPKPPPPKNMRKTSLKPPPKSLKMS